MKTFKDSTDSLLSGGSASKRKSTPRPKRQPRTKKHGPRHFNSSRRPRKAAPTPTAHKVSPLPQRPITSIAPKPPAAVTKQADSLKIYPLGGQEEVGRNCTVFEYGNDIVILDMGMQFPDEDMPGIDYIIPNTSSLEGKKKNIRAVIFSHGHLDHIGAAPMMLEKLGYPLVVGRKLTLAMIKRRQEDYKRGSASKLKTVMINDYNQVMRFGNFETRFFPVDHSIMDAVGLILKTPHGTVIHPGDWTIEPDPMQGNMLDYNYLSKLPSPRILMLESLGVSYSTKKRVPVKETLANLTKLIDEAQGRIIIGTFSSMIERIKYLIEHAEKIGKKVALDGYSMKMNVEIAKELGYIDFKKTTLIPINKIDDYPDNKIVVICTGAQGESNAVFARIVNGQHKSINIKKSDTVVFSSSIIPGNEATIQKLKDQIYRLTENVMHGEFMNVHSGGHANAEDIVTVLNQIKPDYFVPVYANYYMLVEAKKLAARNGFKPDNIIVLNNGDVLEFKKGQPQPIKEKVTTDYVMVDGLGVGDVSNVVLRDRQVMAADGMIVIIATVSRKNGHLVHSPDIISRGFIYMRESKKLVEEIRGRIKNAINEHHKTHTTANDTFIKDTLRNSIGQFIFQKTKRRPMILPVVIEV